MGVPQLGEHLTGRERTGAVHPLAEPEATDEPLYGGEFALVRPGQDELGLRVVAQDLRDRGHEVLRPLPGLQPGRVEDARRSGRGGPGLLGRHAVHETDEAEGPAGGHGFEAPAFVVRQIQHGRGPAEHSADGQRVEHLREEPVAGVDHAVGLEHERLARAQRRQGDRQGHQVACEVHMDEVRVADQTPGGCDQGG